MLAKVTAFDPVSNANYGPKLVQHNEICSSFNKLNLQGI